MIHIDKEEQCCANCVYFRQHYIYSPNSPFMDLHNGFLAISWGHCQYPRFKCRRPTDCCKQFERVCRE